jgi:hypothetical protein
MLDGGPGAEPDGELSAWLVTDDRGEFIRDLRRLARTRGLEAVVGTYDRGGLSVEPRLVVHTSHPTYGYLIHSGGRQVVWAPEFIQFPAWADGADLMFADAAGWDRPIRFAGGAGGHAPVIQVAREARDHGVRRLVFAHVGRPTIRALDAGQRPPFGVVGADGDVYLAVAAGWRRIRGQAGRHPRRRSGYKFRCCRWPTPGASPGLGRTGEKR